MFIPPKTLMRTIIRMEITVIHGLVQSTTNICRKFFKGTRASNSDRWYMRDMYIACKGKNILNACEWNDFVSTQVIWENNVHILTDKLFPRSSRSRGSEISSAKCHVLHMVWKPVVQYSIHILWNSSVQSQISPVHIFQFLSLKVHFSFILLSKSSSSNLSFLFVFKQNCPMHFPLFIQLLFALLTRCLMCLLLRMFYKQGDA
jgi:hypothetical protein